MHSTHACVQYTAFYHPDDALFFCVSPHQQFVPFRFNCHPHSQYSQTPFLPPPPLFSSSSLHHIRCVSWTNAPTLSRCTPPKPLGSRLSSSRPPLFWPPSMPWPRRGATDCRVVVAIIKPTEVPTGTRRTTAAPSSRCGPPPLPSDFAWRASIHSRRCSRMKLGCRVFRICVRVLNELFVFLSHSLSSTC